jgi:hypothetical protein
MVHGYHQTLCGVRIEWEERVIIMMVKRGRGGGVENKTCGNKYRGMYSYSA